MLAAMRFALIAALAVGLTGACSSAPPKKPSPTPAVRRGTGSVQYGQATFYHEPQMTASGERFNPEAMTAAHRTLKLGTRVRVTNQKNGRSVILRINDRGPYGNAKRIIDVSRAAARQLDMIEAGVVPVKVEIVK